MIGPSCLEDWKIRPFFVNLEATYPPSLHCTYLIPPLYHVRKRGFKKACEETRLTAVPCLLPFAGEYLDYLVQEAMGVLDDEGKEGDEKSGAGGFLGQLQRTARSLSYFMRSLSK